MIPATTTNSLNPLVATSFLNPRETSGLGSGVLVNGTCREGHGQIRAEMTREIMQPTIHPILLARRSWCLLARVQVVRHSHPEESPSILHQRATGCLAHRPVGLAMNGESVIVSCAVMEVHAVPSMVMKVDEYKDRFTPETARLAHPRELTTARVFRP
jgi:hypothetical protein